MHLCHHKDYQHLKEKSFSIVGMLGWQQRKLPQVLNVHFLVLLSFFSPTNFLLAESLTMIAANVFVCRIFILNFLNKSSLLSYFCSKFIVMIFNRAGVVERKMHDTFQENHNILNFRIALRSVTSTLTIAVTLTIDERARQASVFNKKILLSDYLWSEIFPRFLFAEYITS